MVGCLAERERKDTLRSWRLHANDFLQQIHDRSIRLRGRVKSKRFNPNPSRYFVFDLLTLLTLLTPTSSLLPHHLITPSSSLPTIPTIHTSIHTYTHTIPYITIPPQALIHSSPLLSSPLPSSPIYTRINHILPHLLLLPPPSQSQSPNQRAPFVNSTHNATKSPSIPARPHFQDPDPGPGFGLGPGLEG